jgi:probable HAF family extracellular repeat protein
MSSKGKRFCLTCVAAAVFCLSFGGRLVTMQQPDVQETDSSAAAAPPVASAAAGVQLQPQVARGGNGSLAVWVDRRTVLGRYVDTDAAGIGSGSDIYAARYDAGGALIDTTPIIVSQTIRDQIYPRVAWNGQNWLVTWLTFRLSNQYLQDVVGVRVAPDGRVLDAAPIVIGASSASSGNPTYLSVASDGVNWTVVWGAGGYESNINGARVAPDGTLIDAGGSGKVLHADPNFTAPFWADLAYANNQLLLVWEIVSGEGHAVRAQRFSNSLDPVGSPFTISEGATTARVASNGTDFLVMWRAERFTYNEIFVSRVSAAGQVLDPNGIKLFGAIGDYVLPYQNSLCWDGASYVAAFHGRPVSSSNESVFASRVNADGTVATPTAVLLSSSNATQPGVGALASGVAQVVWVDRRLSVDGDIFAATLATNGTVGTVAPASLGTPRESQSRFTKTDAGNFALVYRSTVSGESSIFLQRLDAGGNPLGNPALIVSGSEAITTPAVAWNGFVYLVTWELATQIYGRRVSAEGTPLGDAFVIMPGNEPDVAALGTQFLVVDDYEPTNHIRFTQAVRVAGDGTVLGAPTHVGSNFDRHPRVRAFGARWLVVWEEDISHDNPNSTIIAAFVNQDGTTSGGNSISTYSSDTPHLAIAGNLALVVWTNGGNIRGRRIQADGTLLDNAGGLLLADTAQTLYAPAVAWDGARFVVTYADPRDSNVNPPADIWATLVGADGTVLTLGGFPVADSPLSEDQPTVEASNGVTVFAYSMFDDHAPYASYRVRLRSFPFDSNFYVAAAPFSRTIARGATTTFNLGVNALNGFNHDVSLNVYGLPGGVDASFAPQIIAGGNGSSVLTLATSPNIPEGIYTLTINATYGAQQSRTQVTLVVNDNPPPTGFAVTDLGTLGGTQSVANGVNNSGQVVGYAYNANQKRRAFLYSNGQMQDLGTLGGADSEAFEVNDSGVVVGRAKNDLGDDRAFKFNGGALQDLNTLGGSSSAATAINSAGQVTGNANISTENYHAFFYNGGALQDLGVLGGYWSVGQDINSAGKIVGSSFMNGPSGGPRGIVYANGVMTALGTLGGSDSYANAINDNDQIAGSSSFSPSSISQHAFLFSNGQLRDLGTLGGNQSEAYGINNAGQVVGYAENSSGVKRAFIYDGATMRNLNTLISPSSGWTLLEAKDINNQGQIVGSGSINNQTHAFLLAPLSGVNVPPTVQITNPVSGARLADAASLTVNAMAADTDGTITRVEFYADGVLIGAQTSVPYAILWSGITPNRTYTLTARAIDNTGAATVSAPVTVTITNGNAAPAARFDFDGDGKADPAVFRPSNGTWYLQQSTGGFAAAQFGLSTDKLAPADYDGDGKTDIAVFRDGAWYIQQSSGGFISVQFGTSGDVPQPGDYDGDGKADPAVFRPSNGAWYMLRSRDGFAQIQFGQNGDQPIADDFDGDGKFDAAVYRAGAWYVLGSRDGFAALQFGVATDVPAVGDYDGDGKADYAVFRGGVWYQQRSRDGFQTIQFGTGGDVPAPADYDGDGKTDVAVFRSGNWYMQSGASGLTSIQFGAAGDVPAQSFYTLR